MVVMSVMVQHKQGSGDGGNGGNGDGGARAMWW